jgi:ankyrin repeat protein
VVEKAPNRYVNIFKSAIDRVAKLRRVTLEQRGEKERHLSEVKSKPEPTVNLESGSELFNDNRERRDASRPIRQPSSTETDPKERSTADLNEDFLIAAMLGDPPAVQSFIAKGVDIECKDAKGWTALILASEQRRLEVVRWLLAKGADRNAKASDGETALMKASSKRSADIVRALLGTLTDAAKRGDAAAVQALVASGANVNESVIHADDTPGETALIIAIGQGHRDVAAVLMAMGADINKKGFYRNTALKVASGIGDVDLVQALLAKGL